MKITKSMKTTMSLAAAMGTFALAAGSAQAATLLIDTTFANGNGSFEFDSSGTQLATGAPNINVIGKWISGDATFLSGIDRATTGTREWGGASVGVISGAVGNQTGTPDNNFGLIQNTGYTVSAGSTFDLSFDWNGDAVLGGWDADDNLQVALFTSSNDTLGGTLTQIWSGSYLDGNTSSSYQTISLTGVGTIIGASVGQDLFIAFGTGTAGADNGDNNFATVDNVNLTAVPEPTSTALLGLGGLALILRRRK